MNLEFNPTENEQNKANPKKTDSYVDFRSSIPKPTSEDAHIRHILRFYIVRSFLKMDCQEAYVLPDLSLHGDPIKVDVLGVRDDGFIAGITEPASVNPETEDVLEQLKDCDDVQVVVVHSQYGNPGKVKEKFGEQIESRKFRVLSVVPPPFDDVYEYDIWMFDLTFRETFKEE
jgi:hypothetical protein